MAAKKKAVGKKAAAKKVERTVKVTSKKLPALPVAKNTDFAKKYLENPKSRVYLTALLIILLLAAGLFYKKEYVVVATVNGKPITRLSLARELEKQGGKQVLEGMITNELIMQEANKQGIVVTQEQIDAEIAKIDEQLKAQGQDLETALAAQGQTRESLINNIKLKLSVEGAIGKEIEVTDEEISQYFNENKDFLAKDATLETEKEGIKEQLYNQKLNEKYQSWLEEIKSSSSVNYFLEL